MDKNQVFELVEKQNDLIHNGKKIMKNVEITFTI
jgi:hypothetical protein